ncbi:hypothetical protein FPRO04_12317 [Fusarium proliferatum]|nr:hypothetical protein FPRO04_12317 [Fusarium proliferatum]
MTKNETLTVLDGFTSALVFLRNDEPPKSCLDDKLDAVQAWSSAYNIQHESKATWDLLVQTKNPAIIGFLTKSWEQAIDICYDGMITIYMAEDNMAPQTLNSAFSFFVLSYVISRLSSTERTNKRDILAGMRPWKVLMKRDENKWALFKDLVNALGFTEDIDVTSESDTDSITTTNTNHNLSSGVDLSEEIISSNPLHMISVYGTIRQYIHKHREFWLKLGDGCSPVERGDTCIFRWNQSLYTDPILEGSVRNLQCVYHNEDPKYRGIVQIILRLHRMGYLQSVDVLASYMTRVSDVNIAVHYPAIALTAFNNLADAAAAAWPLSLFLREQNQPFKLLAYVPLAYDLFTLAFENY